MYMWIVIALSLIGWINFNFGSPNWFRGQLVRLVLGVITGALYAFFGMPALVPGLEWLPLALPLVLNALYTLVESAVTRTTRGIKIAVGLLGIILLAVAVLGVIMPAARAKDLRDLAQARSTEQAVSAIDVAHIRLVPIENADWKARKAIGNLGINYEVGALSVQKVNGRLFWVAPLEFRSFWKWLTFKTSPGYILVDAEDPQKPAEVKTGYDLRYMESAYFFSNLKRHTYLRHGRYRLVEPSFELDDQFKPWVIYSMLRPSVGLTGEKVVGAVLVDPQTGAMTPCMVGEAPEWVDRIVPETTAEKYNTWFGKYVHGFWNSVFAGRDVHKPTGWGGVEVDVFGVIANDRFFWFTGHTSPTTRDDSLVGYTMMDARNGKMTYYKAKTGLLNEAAAVSAVNSNVANYRGWHGAQPLFYNIYGAETWVVPVLSEDDKFQGVGIVHALSGQTFFRPAKDEVLTVYRQWLATGQNGGSPTQSAEPKTLTAVVQRISPTTANGSTLFYFTLSGSKGIFTANVENSPEVPLTRSGDSVSIEYLDTGEKVLPVAKFDNEGI